MTQPLTGKLDRCLRGLATRGFAIRAIFASPVHIQQVLVERGESAISLDADPAQDRAWYGPYEVHPNDCPDVSILFCEGNDCWIRELTELYDELIDDGAEAT